MLRITEIFNSIQGEGIDTGLPAIFIRLAGCNMSCSFCDTDFSQREELDEDEIISRLAGANLVILTGGEPTEQNIIPLVIKLKQQKFRVGIETNGTNPIPEEIFDSISLSPKIPRADCNIKRCHSLKILWPPVTGISPWEWKDFPAEYKSLQIIDPDDCDDMVIGSAIEAARQLGHPWRVGLQIHKFLRGVK